MDIRVGLRSAGWAHLVIEDGADVLCRFDRAPSGRVVVVEIAFADRTGVTSEALRAVPTGRLEGWANGPVSGAKLREAIEARSSMDAETLAALDTEHRAEPWKRATWGTSPEAQAGMRAMEALCPPPQSLGSRAPSFKLNVPRGQPKPDSFYRQVAKVYSAAAAVSKRPAREIADANSDRGVTVERVHGWVKEARNRNLLAPGSRTPKEGVRR